MPGFFELLDMQPTKPPPAILPRCGACGLYKQCNSPKMKVDGYGERKILLFGEAPGEFEDKEGRPFVGRTGKYLEERLEEVGINMRRDCWITNSLRCRPTQVIHGQVKNKNPTQKQIEYCRPYLIQAINELKPEIIVPIGSPAVVSLIGWLWKDHPGGIEKWMNWQIPCQRLNAWLTPIWHPSYVIRGGDSSDEDTKEKFHRKELKELLYTQQIARIVELQGRPWKQVPDYSKKVEVCLEVARAAQVLRKFIENGKPVAIDIECDRINPDSGDSIILTCSVSDGITTIAYPWYGEVIKATKELLLSSLRKIAWNDKYEIRWFKALLGVDSELCNWYHDGMLAAHVLDNRQGTKSLKFWAFTHLGQESYDDHVKPFMVADGSNTRNRLHEVPIKQLLQYNAMDSLLEAKLAKIQSQMMGKQLV